MSSERFPFTVRYVAASLAATSVTQAQTDSWYVLTWSHINIVYHYHFTISNFPGRSITKHKYIIIIPPLMHTVSVYTHPSSYKYIRVGNLPIRYHHHTEVPIRLIFPSSKHHDLIHFPIQLHLTPFFESFTNLNLLKSCHKFYTLPMLNSFPTELNMSNEIYRSPFLIALVLSLTTKHITCRILKTR